MRYRSVRAERPGQRVPGGLLYRSKLPKQMIPTESQWDAVRRKKKYARPRRDVDLVQPKPDGPKSNFLTFALILFAQEVSAVVTPRAGQRLVARLDSKVNAIAEQTRLAWLVSCTCRVRPKFTIGRFDS